MIFYDYILNSLACGGCIWAPQDQDSQGVGLISQQTNLPKNALGKKTHLSVAKTLLRKAWDCEVSQGQLNRRLVRDIGSPDSFHQNPRGGEKMQTSEFVDVQQGHETLVVDDSE